MLVDIFISYSNADREKAHGLACLLQAKSFSVFWDRIIPVGKCFDEEIETALREARCVIVLWSKFAVSSEWVRAEAEDAAKRKILVPVLIEDITLPLRFRQIQAANLKSWNLDINTDEIQRLIEAIENILDMPVISEREEIKAQIGTISQEGLTIDKLTAAEALVLLDPYKDQGIAAFKLTLKELLVRQCILIHKEDKVLFFGRIRHTDYLKILPEGLQRAQNNRHLQIVLFLLEKNCKNGMLAINKIASRLRKAFGERFSLYQSKYIIPRLISHGLLNAQKTKVYWLFSQVNYHYTEQGEKLRSRLMGQLENAKNLPVLLCEDRNKAIDIITGLGISILLTDEAISAYKELIKLYFNKDNNTDINIDSHINTNFDIITEDNSDFTVAFDFDINAFDTLDSSLMTFDTGLVTVDTGVDFSSYD